MGRLRLLVVEHMRGGLLGRAEHGGALGVVGQAGLLDEAVGDVDPEAVDAPVEPEPQDGLELRPDLRVVPVEVGLLGVEQVQVPLAGRAVGLGDAGPGRAAEDRVPVVGRQLAVLALALPEQVAVPLGGAGTRGEGSLEPRVLVGAVVGHQVDDHPDPQLVGARDEGVGVAEVTEDGVDVAVVGDVVARVGLRAPVERRQPERVDAEGLQVLEVRGDAGQVAQAVAVRVGPRPRDRPGRSRRGATRPRRGAPAHARGSARGGASGRPRSSRRSGSRCTMIGHWLRNAKQELQELAACLRGPAVSVGGGRHER